MNLHLTDPVSIPMLHGPLDGNCIFHERDDLPSDGAEAVFETGPEIKALYVFTGLAWRYRKSWRQGSE